MKNKQCKVFLAASALLFCATFTPLAFAGDDFYVGAGVGISQSKDACDGLGGAGFTGTCDKKDSGFKLVAGYKFTPYLGAEVGYVSLGEFKAVGTAGATAIDATAKAKGLQLAGFGMLELDEDFWFIGKLGVFSWDLDSSGSLASSSETGTDLFFSIGVQYDVSRRFSIRGEWEKFMDVGVSGAESDIDLISVNGLWRF
ncbi:MAG TPA: outer membrane beta-barrel protein [Burkholderiales bacterium]|nr:outer membrane beta-barrel protein [Burkholderiales bacterium]